MPRQLSLRLVLLIIVAPVAIVAAGQASAPAASSAASQALGVVPGVAPWSTPTAQLAGDTPFGPGGLACTTHDFCISVDAFGGTYLYEGGSWSKSRAVMPETPTSVNDPNGISPEALDCASPSLCVAGGNDGAVWLWNGTSWRTDFAANASAQNVIPSCPRNAAAPVCYLAIGNTFARYDGQGTWQALGPINATAHSSADISLSCPSAAFCAAVDADGTEAFIWQGRSWGQPSEIPGLPSDAINWLSCPAAGQCMLFPTNLDGTIQAVWRYTRGQWTKPLAAGTSALEGSQQDVPDCVSVSECLVATVGASGNGALAVVQFAPSANAVRVTQDSSFGGMVLAVSCGSVCALGLQGGSFTDAALSAPVIASVSPSAGSTSGIAPYQAAGVALPPAIRVQGDNLELASEVLFGTTPAASWQVESNHLILAQPPPGQAGAAVVQVAWAGGLTGPTPGSTYEYRYRPLRVSVSSEPTVSGQTGQPALISVDVVVANEPIGRAQLVWREVHGPAAGAASLGPLPPGRYRLQLYASNASLTALNAEVRVCIDAGGSSVACGFGGAVITSPPLTSQPWWVWLIAGLLIGAVLAVLASSWVRRRRRLAKPVASRRALETQP